LEGNTATSEVSIHFTVTNDQNITAHI
jgi:hypothetical protein